MNKNYQSLDSVKSVDCMTEIMGKRLNVKWKAGLEIQKPNSKNCQAF
jgi:hypothetical protein